MARLKLMVLRSLANVAPMLQPEQALFCDVGLQLSEPPTMSEFRAALAELEEKRRIVSVRDEDRRVKWKITDNGQARLAELR